MAHRPSACCPPAGTRTGTAANVQDGRRVSGLSLLAAAAPYPSHELVISELDNVKYAPDIAFNSKHNEYLVVWENKWGAHHDILCPAGFRFWSTAELVCGICQPPWARASRSPRWPMTPAVTATCLPAP